MSVDLTLAKNIVIYVSIVVKLENMPKYKSETLGMEYETREDNCGCTWCRFSDGITYSPQELEIISGSNDDMIKSVHKAKDIMGGTVVKLNKGMLE